jgi:hypothetical protein
LAELLIYNAAVSDDERRAATAYLAAKYGIPLLYNNDQAPSVTLTNAATGTVNVPADVTLHASASDSDGSIAQVGFYANGVLVSSVAKSPFTLPAHISTPGNVNFTAVATDNLGLTSTSGPVAVTASGPMTSMSVTNGLQLWLKADAGVTAGAGGAVTSWADQSGHANNAAQSDPTLAPSLVSNSVNSQPVVRFDGTTRYLEFAGTGLTLLNDVSSFFVVKPDDFATFRGVWGQTTGGKPAPNDYYLTSGSGVPVFNRGDGSAVSGVNGARAVPAGNYAVLGFDAVGTNVNHYWNGALNGTGTITTATADGGTPVRLGSRDDTVTQMKGDIAEVLIYNRGLSDGERSTIASYLAAKYTIPFVSVTSVSTNGPALSIAGNSTAGFVISWPASVTGFTLETSGTLTKPTWTPVTGVQNNTVTVMPTGPAAFYRLHKP